MLRKLVGVVFVFAIVFGQYSAFAKIKHSKKNDDVNKIAKICKVEKKVATKNSRLDKKPKIKIKEENKKRGGLLTKYSNKREKPESRKERAARKAAKLKSEKQKRMVRRDAWRKEQNKKRRELAYKNKMRKEKLIAEKQMAFNARRKAMKKWRAIRLADIENDYQDGKFADLYKKPAWPNHMLYAERDNLIHATANYNYATNWFNSEGSTQDLSAGTFGEQDFYFRDILLALELNKRTVGGNTVLTAFDGTNPWANLKDDYYNKKIIFHADRKQFGINLDYGRYVKDKDVFIGFEVPVAYQSRKLKFDSDVLTVNEAAAQDAYLRTFMKEAFEYMLHPKGLTYREKVSITGIGDISTFINFNVRTKYLEQFKWGAKVVWPTAKGADTSKLMAPELGKGFTQIKLFTALMFNKRSYYFNPHMFIQGTYFVSGHKNKRVPKIITFDGVGNANVGATVMAHGDRVDYNAIAFSEPDSKIVAFADNVKNVKIRPGAEVEFRLGNIIEKVISRRGFVDLYYDFRAKWEDDVINSGLDAGTWQTHRLEENTTEIEHTIGADFSYQFDIHTRLNLGAKYTFAGINVADTFAADFGVSVEF